MSNVRETDSGELFVGFHQRAYRVRLRRLPTGTTALEVDVGTSYQIRSDRDDRRGVGELIGHTGSTRTLFWQPITERIVPVTEKDRIPRDLHQTLVAHFTSDSEGELTAAS